MLEQINFLFSLSSLHSSNITCHEVETPTRIGIIIEKHCFCLPSFFPTVFISSLTSPSIVKQKKCIHLIAVCRAAEYVFECLCNHIRFAFWHLISVEYFGFCWIVSTRTILWHQFLFSISNKMPSFRCEFHGWQKETLQMKCIVIEILLVIRFKLNWAFKSKASSFHKCCWPIPKIAMAISNRNENDRKFLCNIFF